MSTMKTIGVGRIVNELQLRQVGTTFVLDFTLAIDEHIKKKDGSKDKITHFLDFQAWDKGAEVINQYAKKGDQIFVSASPRKDVWEKDGVKKSKVFFRVDEFRLMPNGRKSETSQPENVVHTVPDDEPF